jgi:hypothetical protein
MSGDTRVYPGLKYLKPEDYAENNGALGRLSVMHSCTSVQQFTPDAVTEAVELSIGQI